MRIFAALLLLAFAGFGSTGCMVVKHPDGDIDIIIPHGHIHDAHCGHYKHHGRWRILHGHIHGPGCGHHLAAGIWIVKD